MQEVTFISDRGALTLPASIRKALGIRGGQQFIVATNKLGEIVLKPAVSVPIELYSEERIAEFSGEEKLVGKWLDKHWRKK